MKEILIFAAGFGLGFAAGYYLLSDTKEKEKQAEIDSVKETYKEAAAKWMEVDSYDELQKMADDSESATTAEEEPLRTAYSTMARGYVKESEEPAEVQKLTMEAPYEISQEDYENTERQYDKVTLKYYAEDGLLVDEDDMPVDAPERLVGENFDQMIGPTLRENGIGYIRNDRLEIDFEIEEGDT